MANNMIIYTTADGLTKVETTFDRDTVWLTREQMATLFQRDRSVISRHIQKVFSEGELDEKSNVQKMHVPNSDKPVVFYNLDVIISVGYQDIFQLIIITDLKVLKSLDKLAVRLGFYKSLDICRLDLKIRKGRRKYLAVCVNDTKFRP